MFRHWFKKSKFRVRVTPRSRAARPWLEQLEDRLAPAIYTVDRLGDNNVQNPMDNSKGDIRYVINQANRPSSR